MQLQTSSTQKLKERLILASRILAVFFLVLAFAQPYLQSKQHAGSFQRSIVSIYLDDSYSMESVNKNGSLLDEGKRKIKELLDAYSLNDRFQLLTNDFDGKQQRLISKEELLDELNEVKISPMVRNYQSVIDRQQELLLEEQQVRRIAYLISDFQSQGDFKNKITIDSSIQLNLVPLYANELPNVSIDSVYFTSPFHQPGGKERLVAVVSNHSDKNAENIPLRLTVNGTQKSLGAVSVKPHSSHTDTLDFSGLKPGWQSATLNLKDYPIIFDDVLNFSFEVKQKIDVLSVYQDQPVRNLKLAYQTDSYFEDHEVNESQIKYSELNNNQLIILENLKSISVGLAQQLQQYVEHGGSLSVFIPLDADLNNYQQVFSAFGIDFPQELKHQPIKATSIDLQHPIFKDVFDQLPKNPDLPVASSYFSSSGFTKTTKQVLISGEGAEPLLSVYPIKKGKLYLSFLPLEGEASNFGRHALFLPILFKMALLGIHQQTLFYTIGKNTAAIIPNTETSENEVLKIKNKETEIIPEVIKKPAGSTIYFSDQIKKPGFYQILKQNELLSVLAFNENRKESVMKFYQDAELQKLFGVTDKNILKSNTTPMNQQIKEVNLGSSLWKLCLILTLVFLLTEMLLIRFFKGQKVKPINLS